MVMRYLGGINSPSYNPLAANVTTGVTTVQDGGIYTTTSAAQAVPNQQWVIDPYFQDNILLLQADNVVNGAQNNTFLDASENNLAVIRSGNSTQGTFTPFSSVSGYWCNTFDGAGDYLTVPDDPLFEPGTDPFCVEFWFFANSITGTPVITTKRAVAASTGASFQVYLNAGAVTVGFSTIGNLNVGLVSVGAAIPNQWNHVAAYRIGNAWYGSLNGVVTVINASSSGSLNNNTAPIVIGGDTNSNYFNGYVSNYRFVVGDSVYTSSNFTPPTSPLTPISGTQLLTCMDSRALDESSNNFPVSFFGNTACRPSAPFYNPNFSAYSSTGSSSSSVYLSGSIPYGTVKFGGPTISATTSTFTIEGWVNGAFQFAATSPNYFIEGTLATYYLQFGVNSSARVSLDWLDGSNVQQAIQGSTVLSYNIWYHIAVSVSSNSVSIYVNGVLDATGTLTNRFATANQGFIGGYLRGSVSNISVLSGVAKYSGATITVPTSPLPSGTVGQVLLFAKEGIIDSNTATTPKTISIEADQVTVSPFSPFSDSTSAEQLGSMFFDGTGDYLNLGGPSQLAFGTNDFTIECWVYLNALPVSPAHAMIYDSRPASTDGAYPCVYIAHTTSVLTYYVSTSARITGTTAIKLGQWNYVVVSRVSGETRMFLNGVQEGSTYTDSTTYLNGANRPVIANNGLNLTGTLTGYISNLRVLNGTGSTTSTVPTAPLTAVANTQLLLNGSNAGIADATEKSVMETVGNAQVSTAIKKYGSGSMSFDGTGDWLLIPHNVDINFGAGNFTVEAWVNLTNTSASRSLIGKGTASTGWGIYFNAQPTLFIFNYAGSIAYSPNYNLIEGQWYHLAVTRSGTGTNNLKMFINGSLVYEATVTTDLSTTNNMYVGANRVGGAPMFGYVDDLRLTNGVARYTSNFIPPTVGFQRLG